MAINLHCSECKSTSSLQSKHCKRCGFDFGKGKKYRVTVKGHDGKRVSKVLDSISMAKNLEGKLKIQALEKNLFGISQSATIDEIWEKYLEWARQNKKSWKDDQSRWEHHIYPLLKGKRIDSIIPFDIQKIIHHMRIQRDYAPATVRQVLVLVKRVYNWTSEMGFYRGENPASKIRLPKLNNEVTEYLTREEVERLLSTLDGWVNQRAALLIKFALYTGLRRGEIFNLKWKDVDLSNGTINLGNTKGGKDEILPISDEAISIAKKASTLLPIPDCPYVFPNRQGRKRTSMGNIWTRIKKSASLRKNFRLHGLRHTFASYLASSGKVSQYTLQKLLTHKTPQMTQRYAHLFDETLREATNLLPSLF